VPVDDDAPNIFVLVDGDQLYVVVPEVLVIFELRAMDGAVPEQMVAVEGVAVAAGVGLMVIVNDLTIPEHVVAVDNDGVTCMVAVPALVAVNTGILPVPLAPKPIDVLLFVQAKLVPVTAPEKVIKVEELLLQNVTLLGCATSGAGLTVTVAVVVGPLQPTPLFVYVGVIV
jgi:hypothetical protein